MIEPKGETSGSNAPLPKSGAAASEVGLREAFTDAIRYWERRRIVYNAVLILIVVWYFVAGLPESSSKLRFDVFLVLFVQAVVANFLYCAAYPIDAFAQLSSKRAAWLRLRWLLFLIGLTTAAIMARFGSEFRAG